VLAESTQVEMDQQVSAAGYLLAIEGCQAFIRVVARFLTGIDGWLTPTLSTPPTRIPQITSTPQEPMPALAIQRTPASVQCPLPSIQGSDLAPSDVFDSASGA
jgi:hypothetical protein